MKERNITSQLKTINGRFYKRVTIILARGNKTISLPMNVSIGDKGNLILPRRRIKEYFGITEQEFHQWTIRIEE